ncbi:MAG: hypothetical protein KAU95_03270, partial [Candidatus Aenigmarchaeota archaeon]|nr:hypothetical protein [Candidatus Aenigmarchaeota archaeon]
MAWTNSELLYGCVEKTCPGGDIFIEYAPFKARILEAKDAWIGKSIDAYIGKANYARIDDTEEALIGEA